MKVTRIDLPALPKHGLSPIKMERLKDVVILAGQNGAGKSRLLQRISDWTKEKLPLLGLRCDVERWLEDNVLARMKAEESSYNSTTTTHFLERGKLWKSPEIRNAVHKHWPGSFSAWDEIYEIEVDQAGRPNFVFFVPKDRSLADANLMPPGQLVANAKNAEKLGVTDLSRNTTALIQSVQNRWWNATHQESTLSQSERDKAIQDYQGLCSLIKRFLKTNLLRSIDGEAQIFGLPLGRAHLSDGQTILLQFCVLVHAQAGKLSESIVLMDEPENHLHPGAMLDAISEIQKALTNGQLWIATHSVHLLAHFDPDYIWWMDKGGIRHAGSKPEAVLKSLLGDDERIGKLSLFLGLPAELAANNFAFQCLLPPKVVAETTGDPQTSQICSMLRSCFRGHRMRVLDIGAGRGRLASALRDGTSSFEDVPSQIDYLAFDPSPEHKIHCEAAISRLHGSAMNRYFNEDSEIRAVINGSTVNVAVMCNVLHEIDPTEWVRLFREGGMIRHLLSSDGFLLIVEDLEMRVGELAHDRGFLVLDTADIRLLFALPESVPGFVVDDARGNGRLKAYLVPARYLGNVSMHSLKKTLKQVLDLASDRIRKLRENREDKPSYPSGRKHAFYVHQLANAKLALDILGD